MLFESLPAVGLSFSVGVLFLGISVFTYLYVRTREPIHLATVLLGLTVAWFNLGELGVFLASEQGDVSIGWQIDRVQALAVASIFFSGHYLGYNLYGLTPRWRRVNRMIWVVGLVAFFAFCVVAFAAPDLYVSVSTPAPPGLGIRWIAYRGRPGPLYYLRDVLVLLYFVYVIVQVVFEIRLNHKFRYMKWLIGGLVFGVATVLIGLSEVHGTADMGDTGLSQISVVTIGGTVYVVCAMLTVMQQFLDTRRDVEQAYRLRSLGLFAGGIAHDFKNVLVAISGSSAMIRTRAKKHKEILEFSDVLDKATSQSYELVERLATFSREQTAVLTSTSLAPVLSETRKIVAAGTVENTPRVNIDIEVEPDLPPVHINRGQIIHVLQNLLLNGVQAMSKEGTVRVKAWRDSSRVWQEYPKLAGREFVRISVKDEGRGIQKKDLWRVFEPYYSTKKDGTGLGLAISKSVVEDTGGFIYVSSNPGVGTEFDVYLPIG